jgi:hypothetical protein
MFFVTAPSASGDYIRLSEEGKLRQLVELPYDTREVGPSDIVHPEDAGRLQQSSLATHFTLIANCRKRPAQAPGKEPSGGWPSLGRRSRDG